MADCISYKNHLADRVVKALNWQLILVVVMGLYFVSIFFLAYSHLAISGSANKYQIILLEVFDVMRKEDWELGKY